MSNTSSIRREWPDNDARDELRLAREFLDFLRVTAVMKATGLSTADASATPLPTSPLMSVLGVLKHLAAVERYWITVQAGGRSLPLLWDPDDVHAEWRLGPDDTVEAVVDAYRAEWAVSAESLAGLVPDDRVRSGQARTVRWVLAHVAQETARHVGHLDVLREMADGEVGE